MTRTALAAALTVATAPGRSAPSHVHRAAGTTRWHSFTGRRQLRSATEAVGRMSLAPGASGGGHLQTRTEVACLVLSGEGEFLVNGGPVPVRAGSLTLAGAGSSRELRNTADTDLDLLVVETVSPPTHATLSGSLPPYGGTAVSSISVLDLFEARSIDTTGTFTGPLRQIEIVDIPAGDIRTLGAPDAELACYVISGGGTVTSSATDAPVVISADTCITTPAGSENSFAAIKTLRLAVVTLRLPVREATQ
ncbi:cupin domain-containing protein [Streptomyces olivoreticuli]